MDRYVFAVDDQVFCCWEHDLAERNERFLSLIDGGYFNYVAQRHADQLEGKNRQSSAVALRAAYHHGLETFFSLLGALTQAPGAVPAWIPKSTNTSLRHLVESLRVGDMVLTQAGRQHVTIQALASLVHRYCWPDDSPAGFTGVRFGQAWIRFAKDFLDPHYIAEYNCIKHGFRVSSGGFVLSFGEEEEYGVIAPEENMHTLGASPFGTSFYEEIPLLEDGSSKFHFRIRQRAINWRAEAMVQRLQLVAWSINNVVSALRCINGTEPHNVQFYRPEDPVAFENAWCWNVGVHTSNIDFVIDPSDFDLLPRTELRRELESRGVQVAE